MHERNRTGAPARGLTLALAALALAATTLAWQQGANAVAQNGAEAVKTRVAVVDIQRIINSLDELAVQIGNVQRRVNTKFEEYQTLVGRMEQLQADFSEREMTNEERNDMRVEMSVLASQLESYQSVLQQLASSEEGVVLTRLFAKVEAAVAEHAQREGYDVVLADDTTYNLPQEGSPQQAVLQALRGRTLMYRADELDITDRVINEMNARFNAGG